MFDWLAKHTAALQALAAIGALFAVVGGVWGVKAQLDAAARLQREQSARDIYRDFLTLSISQPKFASPDYCAIQDSADEPAYQTYVQYLLYTSEQVLAALPGWEATMEVHLNDHADLLCGEKDWAGDTPEVQRLIKRFQTKACQVARPKCGV